MSERIKNYLFPRIDPDVQRNIDEEGVRNLHRLSFLVMIFEFFALLLFAASGQTLDRAAWISIGSVLFCAMVCLAGFLHTGWMMKYERTSHWMVLLFKIGTFLLLSVWAIFVSYRQYHRGEQLLTFYAVELMMVCFIPLRPIHSVISVGGIYAALYGMLYSIDGAKGLNIPNFVVLALVSIAGVILRYYSQVGLSERSVQLARYNDLLKQASRHDALTGLRNRKALNEDIPQLIGRRVMAYMIDINAFKQINDTYGHLVGDAALQETAKQLKKLFPKNPRYRYGGDEFLVLGTEEEAYRGETFLFSTEVIPEKTLLLSIGRAEGVAEDQDRLSKLIAEADADLYEVKRKAHVPASGNGR
ncbi:MAG: diguanylate cyclase [Oscillospiraceae bacterium]|nr:diguanylate cyclase [Oscillospiraceae bacterium]